MIIPIFYPTFFLWHGSQNQSPLKKKLQCSAWDCIIAHPLIKSRYRLWMLTIYFPGCFHAKACWAEHRPPGALILFSFKLRAAQLISWPTRVRARTVPGPRAALGLDSQSVQRAYQGFYDVPLDSIYVAETSTLDRLRWAWTRLGSWLEGLPPFWSVFALTLTETVGAGIGPLPGIILLLVFGLTNVLTVAYMAETASRSSDIRYGRETRSRCLLRPNSTLALWRSEQT